MNTAVPKNHWVHELSAKLTESGLKNEIHPDEGAGPSISVPFDDDRYIVLCMDDFYVVAITWFWRELQNDQIDKPVAAVDDLEYVVYIVLQEFKKAKEEK